MKCQKTSISLTFCGNCQGNVAMIFAAACSVSVGVAAFAVDIGSLYLEKQQAQGVVDLAALAAAADIRNAERAAGATLTANQLTGQPTLVITRGHYSADASIPPPLRFSPNTTPYNAVSIRLSKTGAVFFSASALKQRSAMSVSAIGVSDAQTVFSVGSRLASVRDGIPNAILGALIGANTSLSAVDYQALASGKIAFGSFSRALATQAAITALTFGDVLRANVTLQQALRAMAEVSSQNGQTAASLALANLAAAADPSLTLKMDKVIDLGSLANLAIGSVSPGLQTNVDVLNLVSGAATIANGQRQVSLDLGAMVPGLAKVTVALAVGEPAQKSGTVSVGQPTSELHTAQIRLRIVAEIGGTGALAGTTIRLPIAVDVASAAARLEQASCDPDGTATIGVVPGIVDAWIGETSNLASWPYALSVWSANLVSSSLFKVTGSAHVSAGSLTETELAFDQSDVHEGAVKTAESSQIVASLASSLVRNASISVNIAGLSLITPATVQAAVANSLGAAAVPLDSLVHTLLETLGVHLGEADVRVYGLQCRGAVLGG